MEREILFRGKRIDNGEWVKGIYSPYNWDIFGDCMVKEPQIIIISDDENSGLWCDVIPETVGQYTGLNDKNGRKIFEGDIVKHDNKIYVIKYLEKYARFAPTNSHSVFMVCAFEQLEIIGNIHDNPELLKEE